MSRAPLKILIVLIAAVFAVAAYGLDPHMDPSTVPGSCAACHEGHGASRSPMLPTSQLQVCLSCHGTQARLDREILKGTVAPGAKPTLLSGVLSQPYTHPVDPQAFSRYEPGATTCTSCHSPHRGARAAGGGGQQKVSTLDPSMFEYKLCESCHGSLGARAQSPTDVSRLLNPSNRSYHPVEAPSANGSPSVLSSFAGQSVSCTDCHGNADRSGPAGPHGSTVPFILRREYSTADGTPESATVYGLCYGCHDRDAVLDSTVFPEHRRHVVDKRASCATCHDPHGSVRNRALIRFGDETSMAGVAPSGQTGRLEFVSGAPGSGTCYLTCHGKDHAPASYGSFPPVPEPFTNPLRSEGGQLDNRR